METKVKEMEESLEMMKGEFENMEDYWQGKLDDERKCRGPTPFGGAVEIGRGIRAAGLFSSVVTVRTARRRARGSRSAIGRRASQAAT